MPRQSKKVVEKTLGTRPPRKLSWLKSKPPWTFFCRSVRWMLAALGATALPYNLPRIIPGTKAPFRSASRRYKPCLLCKTVNLITNILGWSRRMLSVNRRSHVIRHVLILRIFGAPKKLCLWQNREEVFNRLNSTNWIELHKGHVQMSRGEIIYRDYGVKSRAGVM